MEPSVANRHSVQFTGDGASYFAIWIVNLVLTILTVGIYSPWAKVRRLRFFYGKTLVDGSPFEFHGSPIAILKGRIVSLLLIIAYTQSAKISVSLWFAVAALLVAAAPWLFWKSLRFRLLNSSYRGVRFGFNGSLMQAYTTLALPILLFLAPAVVGYLAPTQPQQVPRPALIGVLGSLTLLTICLLPWFYLRVKRYQHGHAQFGTSQFSFSGTIAGAYGLAFMILGIGILAAITGLIAGTASGYVLGLLAHASDLLALTPSVADTATSARADKVIAITGGVLVGYLVLLSAYPLTSALAQNFVWSCTTLGSGRFASNVDALTLWRIQFVNVLLLVLTLGLYWPYAVVRTTRYRLSRIDWTGDPAAIAARPPDAPVGATGEEAMEMFGFDLAL